MIPHSKLPNHTDPSLLNDPYLHRFVEVDNKLADAAGEAICNYFKKRFEILDEEDLSNPVTIADQAAEEAMILIFFFMICQFV
ncbi:myo-inositol monophosphatase like 2, HISTIDINE BIOSYNTHESIS 7 [Hibiscus trionum]|uniref:Myo-inositol monophosphatase like 2, HISTIDINE BIOSYNTHESIS 7 n=1 Tax=Hibiscus trionum TaxID=183268 RepID=A0A9W7HGB5_HIBTR|nr:myo-inositol monophosphatase like 2, HISTIDINE BIOSYNTHESIS 7 [Hibiscus trionum]